jgi:hypothetical protein
MMWNTYGVDGRALHVERMPDGGWLARCEHEPESRGDDLAATLLAAVGVETLGADSPESQAAWTRWAAEHAGYILEEAGEHWTSS